MENIAIEIYKELKAESKEYLSLVQKLWTYKFVVVGAVLATAVLNKELKYIGNELGMDVASFGLFLLPVLSLLIDLKTLEIGLHIRVISDFLSKNFNNESLITKWESHVWNNERARKRSKLTAITSLGTSIFILFACFAIIAFMYPALAIYLLLGGILLTLLPLYVYYKIYASLFGYKFKE